MGKAKRRDRGRAEIPKQLIDLGREPAGVIAEAIDAPPARQAMIRLRDRLAFQSTCYGPGTLIGPGEPGWASFMVGFHEFFRAVADHPGVLEYIAEEDLYSVLANTTFPSLLYHHPAIRIRRFWRDQTPIEWRDFDPLISPYTPKTENAKIKPYLDWWKARREGRPYRAPAGGRRPLEQDDASGWREAADEALRLRKKGVRLPQVAARLGKSEGTLKRWVARRRKELGEFS